MVDTGGSSGSLRGELAPARARARLIAVALAVLLAGPTVIAFWSGGYFDAPQIDAGLIAFVLLAAAALLVPRPVPAGLGPRLALTGLAGLAAWTLLSMLWSPLAGSAYHSGQRVVLYAGTLLAAVGLLRSRGGQRAVEPMLAAGTLIVIGYGLSERFLPGLLTFARSTSAQGRLEQPLTYWNAMGELGALGVVLAARLAGDVTRPRVIRVAAAAAGAPLGLGLYLSFSRGALFACVAGLVTLAVAAPRRAQLRAVGVAIVSAVLTAAVSAPLDGVTSLTGSVGHREGQGAIALVAMLIIMAAAALVTLRWTRDAQDIALALPRRAPWIAVIVICAGLALAIVAGAKEHSAQPLGGGGARLVSLQSNRYAYWRVALRAFGQQPLHGVGAGGWAVDWLRWRPFLEGAQDAHSLELQTLAELGIVGLALLAAFLAGVALAARAALRRAPVAAEGAVAASVTYFAHSPLDWDWQMPAVTLVALVLAGLLLALADAGPEQARADSGPEQAPPSAVPEPARGNRSMPVLRGVLAAGAVIVCAWFALGAVQTHDQNQATDLIDSFQTPRPALTARILGLLDTAATLNPDRDIDLLRAQALTRSGHPGAGLRVAARVVADEPLNIAAWTVYGFAARPGHPALFRRAEAKLRQLAPPVAAAP